MILSQKQSAKREVSVLLYDIRSVHNVGSIFRTADGSGVSKIFLGGYTPTPTDRFGRKRKDFQKVSLGAEDSVPFEVLGDKGVVDFLAGIKNDYYIVALEQSPRSVNIFDQEKLAKVLGSLDRQKILLVLGNEVEGVCKEILDVADLIVEIPMLGEKESLNVSIAGAIAIYLLSSF